MKSVCTSLMPVFFMLVDGSCRNFHLIPWYTFCHENCTSEVIIMSAFIFRIVVKLQDFIDLITFYRCTLHCDLLLLLYLRLKLQCCQLCERKVNINVSHLFMLNSKHMNRTILCKYIALSTSKNVTLIVVNLLDMWLGCSSWFCRSRFKVPQ